jgi:type I restriction enzyme M protein
MFQQAFKNIDNVLFKDAGCSSEIDYIEQTSWILFLRYIDDLELEKKDEAELKGQSYEFILDESYRWAKWAMPKNPDGTLNHHEAMAGNDIVDFVKGIFLLVFKKNYINLKSK